MSASSKKKLRKEQDAAALTEKQQKELNEAKQLKRYTWTFIVAMALVVAIMIGVIVRPQINSALNKSTHALTIDGQEISAVELNYYYIDAISDLYAYYEDEYGDYANMYALFQTGLNFADPMSTQTYNPETGETWADYFIDIAINNAKSVYSVYARAMADEDFTLSEDDQDNIDSNSEVLEILATYQGYKNVDKYLIHTYGEGATIETYQKYYEMNTIADAYLADYYDSLEYTGNDYRTYEKDKYNNYSSYSYATYQIQISDYLPEKEANSDGSTVYTDEERENAMAQATTDKNTLLNSGIDSVEKLNEAINKLAVNLKNTDDNGDPVEVSCDEVKNLLYTDITVTDIQTWLGETNRTANELGAIEYFITSEAEDGTQTKTSAGYYIVLFLGCNKNTDPTVNVRHLLVAFEGGTTDDDGNTVYSDDEKAAAEKTAHELLNEWKAGDMTEESFIELVKEHTDDTATAETGGLIENIHSEASIVENFLNWSMDESRQAGDVDIIETEYGFHIMYFVDYDELSYRDLLIDNDMRADASTEWYNGILESTEVEIVNTSRIDLDYYISF